MAQCWARLNADNNSLRLVALADNDSALPDDVATAIAGLSAADAQRFMRIVASEDSPEAQIESFLPPGSEDILQAIISGLLVRGAYDAVQAALRYVKSRRDANPTTTGSPQTIAQEAVNALEADGRTGIQHIVSVQEDGSSPPLWRVACVDEGGRTITVVTDDKATFLQVTLRPRQDTAPGNE